VATTRSGIVVFIILTLINFIVITKGAGRIAEVSARFTLDAMPGKQMAIDADLNAGLIGEDEARKRRSTVAQEADFYGSMDGASKFVRGDAVAGILILFINIIGGLIVGVLQHDMSGGGRGQDLYPADHRRRSGGADSGADHFHRGRPGGNAGRH
jgi:flagellar biosynthesis protein FlhA